MTLNAIIRKVNRTMGKRGGIQMYWELHRLVLKEGERMQKEERKLARKHAALKNKDL
jgi:hypothetical protein